MSYQLYLDRTKASGKLCDNHQLGKTLFDYYRFDFLYSHLFALQLTEFSSLPFLNQLSWLELGTDIAYKIKRDQVSFKSVLDGRLFRLSLTECVALMAFAKHIILPIRLQQMLSITGDNVYWRIEQLTQWSEVPAEAGIAIEFDESQQLELVAAIRSDPARRWCISGDKTYRLTELLTSETNNISLQANFVLENALKGRVHQANKFISMTQKEYQTQHQAIDKACACYTCQHHTMAYLHYLFTSTPLLATQLMAYHNIRLFK